MYTLTHAHAGTHTYGRCEAAGCARTKLTMGRARLRRPGNIIALLSTRCQVISQRAGVSAGIQFPFFVARQPCTRRPCTEEKFQMLGPQRKAIDISMRQVRICCALDNALISTGLCAVISQRGNLKG